MLNAQKIVDVFNEALVADPAAITLLFSIRRACNKALADHPHITVNGPTKDGQYTLSFIGMINGALGSAGSEDLVGVVFDDENNQNIVCFTVVTKKEVGL